MCSPPARDSTSGNLHKASVREKSRGVYLPIGWVFSSYSMVFCSCWTWEDYAWLWIVSSVPRKCVIVWFPHGVDRYVNTMRLFKVAQSDFWVTIPFNFERLEHHHYQSFRKSNVSGVLEKDESFKWGTFYQDLSYHSNEMAPCPILKKDRIACHQT